jgi:S1-C subfamily serine protease
MSVRTILPPSLLAALGCLVALIFAFDCGSRDRGSLLGGKGAMPLAGAAPTAPTTSVASPAPISDQALRTEDEKNTIDVFRRSSKATVFVTQKRRYVDFFGRVSDDVPAGSGSGFVWDNEGHVVTNFHVVKDASALTVTLDDQRTFEATVRGVEPRKDIAVLTLVNPPADLQPISVPAASLKLEVGQKVIAIGNPFGLDHTLTTGVVSALGREVDGIGGVSIRDMIQTDAAINPGNSGGPLLSSAGQLMGMNTMIYSKSGTSAGIGFAVPASTIARVVPQIIKTGQVQQVGLGIQIDPNQRLERRAGIAGVVVLRVQPRSPAEAAGMIGIQQDARGVSLGDVIVGIGQNTVENYDDLYNALDNRQPGDEVEVSLRRKGATVKAKVKLIALE